MKQGCGRGILVRRRVKAPAYGTVHKGTRFAARGDHALISPLGLREAIPELRSRSVRFASATGAIQMNHRMTQAGYRITWIACVTLFVVAVSQEARSQGAAAGPTSADIIADAQRNQMRLPRSGRNRKKPSTTNPTSSLGKATAHVEALADQADGGTVLGFDFYLDPLGAMKPGHDVRGGL